MYIQQERTMRFNGPSAHTMVTRLQDQVNRYEDTTYDRILDLREDISELKTLCAEQALEIREVKNENREMKKQLQELNEFINTAKIAKPRNPSTCSSCGGNHRCDSPMCPKPKERYIFKGEMSKK